MPRIKKSTSKRTSSKPATSKAKTKTAANGNHAAGVYTAPRGDVSIAVPPFWTLRQTNDDLEVESPTESTSVIVTAFKGENGNKRLNAREYLQHFLETAQTKSKPKLNGSTSSKATARFRDLDGDNWKVLFLSNGKTLLLATCNSSLPPAGKEAKLGLRVLESLKLKR